jgi:hypothetical protein
MPSQNKLIQNYVAIDNLPIVAELKKKNKKLKKELEEMKYLVVEMAKLNLPKLEKNPKLFNKIRKIDEFCNEDIDVDVHHIIQIKEEIIDDDEIMEIFDVKQKPNIVYEIEEDVTEQEEQEEQEQKVEIKELVIEEMEDEQDIEEEEQEVVEEEQEEAVEEQEVVEEDVVQEEQEQEEVDVEEEEVVEEQEKVEEIEQDFEEEVVEEQEEAVEEEDYEEIEPIEVEINGKTYYALNNIDSIIYDVDANGDISIEVGKFVNGKPKLNKSK